MSMDAAKGTVLDRRQTPKEWLIFFRNGLIVAFVVALLLFWDSPHSADEISVSIAVPLIIFNLVPVILHSLSPFLPQPPQRQLPAVDFVTLPPTRRRNALIALTTVVLMMIFFFGGCAIFLGSFTYPYLGVDWAIGPARHIAFWMFAISALPVVAFVSFIAGMIYSGKIRDNVTALWLYLKWIRPLSHWPTHA